MMRSLYSGISGLRNHQTRMDVIGNNIANVNTTGYKASRVIFQDIFSQTVQGGAASNPAANVGGTNPMQIGLGIRLSSIDVIHTASAFARTDRAEDMMIAGDGFFILLNPETPVPDPDDDDVDPSLFFTRAGNFTIDDDGYLVSSHGFFVLGRKADIVVNNGIVDVDMDDYTPLERIRLRIENPDHDPNDPTTGPPMIQFTNFTVDNRGNIEVMIQGEREVIAQLQLAMFSNPGGLMKEGSSLYTQTNSSGDAVIIDEPGTGGSGPIMSGGLEMSNVDLATEFTDMIVTQRGFQANSRIITVSDTMLEELVNLKR